VTTCQRGHLSPSALPSRLMHGRDSSRRASCVIKVRVQIPQQAVRHYTATRGVPDTDTLIVETVNPLAAEVLELHVRRVADEPGTYVFKHLKDLTAIVAWLSAPESNP
jgi:hypothetical protein